MIWVNIGRGATLRLVRRRLYPVVADSGSSECDEMYLRTQKLAEQCAESATIIIDYIAQLHSRDLLARFSFTDFHTCSSAVIVLLLNALLHTPCHQLLPVTRGIEALRFMANGSMLAMNGLRLVERLQEGVYRTLGVTGRDSVPDQQLLYLQAPGQSLLQRDTLNIAGDVPYITAANGTASDVAAPDIPPLGLTPFADLEPSLLEYSDQYLTLFGFDGFGSTFDPNYSM